ncbi:kinase-like domain-containing protein [Gigaspora rosea]|uniref:Kinase-like domain-containing protein n=1 Tax=Gigaspora rosea TaxID=44941 RepID=A0A397W372_9GLOM|nr:kinase-like domain-containing protein [Gigaspora rosea]
MKGRPVQKKYFINRRLGQCIIDAEHSICTLENQLDIRPDDPCIFSSFSTKYREHQFIEALQCNFDEVDSMFGFIDQINNSIKNSSTNDNLFYDQSMRFIKEFKDGNIQKADDGNITIIKQFHQDENNDIFVQAALLKASRGLINIAKFYGIIQDTSSPSSRYVIIEWSDHGNLKEYYVKHKPLNHLIKLNFAFDICNGLVFLNALNVLHRDIRPENILITGSTSNFKAKITNFFHSRLMTDKTKNIGVGPGVRYIAPEILKRNIYTHNTYTHNTHTHSILIHYIHPKNMKQNMISNVKLIVLAWIFGSLPMKKLHLKRLIMHQTTVQRYAICLKSYIA